MIIISITRPVVKRLFQSGKVTFLQDLLAFIESREKDDETVAKTPMMNRPAV